MAISWTEIQPAGDTNKNWRGVASDADGSNLIAADFGGRLWTSDDSGSTWIERRPVGDVNKDWLCVASDSDGSNLIAGIYGGRLYTSANSGANWTERQPAGNINENWRSVASDADGSNLTAVTFGNEFYLSDDYGVSWTTKSTGAWQSTASDSDGSNLILGSATRLYTSANSGTDWVERRPAGDVNRDWECIASDSDGSNLLAGAKFGRLYTSVNSGVGWTERQPAGAADQSWFSGASDSDGSTLVAGISAGRLYVSVDSGANWTEEQPAGDIDKSWICVASDSDGSNLIVGAYADRLYIASSLPSKPTNPSPGNGAVKVDFSGLVLDWDDGGGANTFDVHIGPTGSLVEVATAITPSTYTVDIDDVPTEQVIYWRVDATNTAGTITGDDWNFDARPGQVSTFTPLDTAIDLTLSSVGSTWESPSANTDSYNVYFGLESGSLFLVGNTVGLLLDLVSVFSAYNYTYYWSIDAVNDFGTTSGNEVSFTTILFYPPLPTGITLDGDGNPTGTPTGLNFMITVRRLVVAANSKIWYESL